MSGFRFAIPVFAISTLLVAPLRATTSYYAGGATAEGNFNAALGALTLLNPSLVFASGDLGSGGLFNASATGIDFLGLDFVNTPVDFTVNSGKLTGTQQDQRVQINFPLTSPGIYAFGFHITFVAGTASFANWCVGLTASSCTYSLVNVNASSPQFFGIISDAPITASLFIHAASGAPTVVFNDFEAYSVPEPHSMLLVGLGLLILSVLRWKRQAVRA